MDKLLVICGPTATGKTKLAILLANKFGGEIVSADSKQVYKGLNIGTGKDLTKEAIAANSQGLKPLDYYEIGGVKIWGYDLVSPKSEYSVSQYLHQAEKIIAGIQKRKHLPVIVGGTGLYIKGLVDGIPTADVPKNENLRAIFAKKTAEELFEHLAQLDPLRAGSMNSSDRQNPRRLIRAIEVATYKLEGGVTKITKLPKSVGKEVLFIGLNCNKETLDAKIEKRVERRVEVGIEGEIQNLLKEGIDWEYQAMSSLGYRQWRDYFEGRKTKEEVIAEWIKEEKRYAKRQTTWFKKDKRIAWFDCFDPNLAKNVEKLVRDWYTMS